MQSAPARVPLERKVTRTLVMSSAPVTTRRKRSGDDNVKPSSRTAGLSSASASTITKNTIAKSQGSARAKKQASIKDPQMQASTEKKPTADAQDGVTLNKMMEDAHVDVDVEDIMARLEVDYPSISDTHRRRCRGGSAHGVGLEHPNVSEAATVGTARGIFSGDIDEDAAAHCASLGALGREGGGADVLAANQVEIFSTIEQAVQESLRLARDDLVRSGAGAATRYRDDKAEAIWRVDPRSGNDGAAVPVSAGSKASPYSDQEVARARAGYDDVLLLDEEQYQQQLEGIIGVPGSSGLSRGPGLLAVSAPYVPDPEVEESAAILQDLRAVRRRLGKAKECQYRAQLKHQTEKSRVKNVGTAAADDDGNTDGGNFGEINVTTMSSSSEANELTSSASLLDSGRGYGKATAARLRRSEADDEEVDDFDPEIYAMDLLRNSLEEDPHGSNSARHTSWDRLKAQQEGKHGGEEDCDAVLAPILQELDGDVAAQIHSISSAAAAAYGRQRHALSHILEDEDPAEVRKLLAYSVSHNCRPFQPSSAQPPHGAPSTQGALPSHMMQQRSGMIAPCGRPQPHSSASPASGGSGNRDECAVSTPMQLDISQELRTELARQRRLLEHLTSVQQEHLRKLAQEQQAASRQRLSAPRGDPTIVFAGKSPSHPSATGAAAAAATLFTEAKTQYPPQHSALLSEEPYVIGKQLQRAAAHVGALLPPLVTITTAPSSSAAQGIAEREAQLYEKELYRVQDEYGGQLDTERQLRRAERRAFKEILEKQQATLLKEHKEALALVQREARLQAKENASLLYQLTAAHEAVHNTSSAKVQQEQEKRTRQMLQGAVESFKSYVGDKSQGGIAAAASSSSLKAPDLSKGRYAEGQDSKMLVKKKNRLLAIRRAAAPLPPPPQQQQLASPPVEGTTTNSTVEGRDKRTSLRKTSEQQLPSDETRGQVKKDTAVVVGKDGVGDTDADDGSTTHAEVPSASMIGAKPRITKAFKGPVHVSLPPEPEVAPPELTRRVTSEEAERTQEETEEEQKVREVSYGNVSASSSGGRNEEVFPFNLSIAAEVGERQQTKGAHREVPTRGESKPSHSCPPPVIQREKFDFVSMYAPQRRRAQTTGARAMKKETQKEKNVDGTRQKPVTFSSSTTQLTQRQRLYIQQQRGGAGERRLRVIKGAVSDVAQTADGAQGTEDRGDRFLKQFDSQQVCKLSEYQHQAPRQQRWYHEWSESEGEQEASAAAEYSQQRQQQRYANSTSAGKPVVERPLLLVTMPAKDEDAARQRIAEAYYHHRREVRTPHRNASAHLTTATQDGRRQQQAPTEEEGVALSPGEMPECDFFFFSSDAGDAESSGGGSAGGSARIGGAYAQLWSAYTEAHADVLRLQRVLAQEEEQHAQLAAREARARLEEPFFVVSASAGLRGRSEAVAAMSDKEAYEQRTEEGSVGLTGNAGNDGVVVSPAMAAEAAALRAARQRLAKIRDLMFHYDGDSRGASRYWSSSSARMGDDAQRPILPQMPLSTPLVTGGALSLPPQRAQAAAAAAAEGCSKLLPVSRGHRARLTQELADKITSETIHSILGEASEAALMGGVCSTLERELLSLMLQQLVEDPAATSVFSISGDTSASTAADAAAAVEDERTSKRKELQRQEDEEARLLQYLESELLKQLTDARDWTAGKGEGSATAASPAGKEGALGSKKESMLDALARVLLSLTPSQQQQREEERQEKSVVRISRRNAEPSWLSDATNAAAIEQREVEKKEGEVDSNSKQTMPTTTAVVLASKAPQQTEAAEEGGNSTAAATAGTHVQLSTASSTGGELRVVVDVAPLLQSLQTSLLERMAGAPQPPHAVSRISCLPLMEEEQRVGMKKKGSKTKDEGFCSGGSAAVTEGEEEDLRDVIVEEVIKVPVPPPQTIASGGGAVPLNGTTVPLLPPPPSPVSVGTGLLVMTPQSASTLDGHIGQQQQQQSIESIAAFQAKVFQARMAVESALQQELMQRTLLSSQEEHERSTLRVMSQWSDQSARREAALRESATALRAQSAAPILLNHASTAAVSAQGQEMEGDGASQTAAQRLSQKAPSPVRQNVSDAATAVAQSHPAAAAATSHIRDPVTRFIFEWLKEHGDKEKLDSQRDRIVGGLHAAAAQAQAAAASARGGEAGDGRFLPPSSRGLGSSSGSGDSPLGSSSWLSSTNPSSFGPAGAHRFLRGREGFLAVDLRTGKARGQSRRRAGPQRGNERRRDNSAWMYSSESSEPMETETETATTRASSGSDVFAGHARHQHHRPVLSSQPRLTAFLGSSPEEDRAGLGAGGSATTRYTTAGSAKEDEVPMYDNYPAPPRSSHPPLPPPPLEQTLFSPPSPAVNNEGELTRGEALVATRGMHTMNPISRAPFTSGTTSQAAQRMSATAGALPHRIEEAPAHVHSSVTTATSSEGCHATLARAYGPLASGQEMDEGNDKVAVAPSARGTDTISLRELTEAVLRLQAEQHAQQSASVQQRGFEGPYLREFVGEPVTVEMLDRARQQRKPLAPPERD